VSPAPARREHSEGGSGVLKQLKQTLREIDIMLKHGGSTL
jgi:hypothetical protein